MSMSIVVAGATGAIGRTVVQHAARCKDVTRIVALTRSRKTEQEHFAYLFGIYPAAVAVEAEADAVAIDGEDNDNSNATATATATATESKESKKKKKDKKRKEPVELAADGTELKANEAALTQEEMNKITPVTVNWEHFAKDWEAVKQGYMCANTIRIAQALEGRDSRSGSAAAGGGGEKGESAGAESTPASRTTPLTSARDAADDKRRNFTAAVKTVQGRTPVTKQTENGPANLREQMVAWRALFGGHTAAAMCLGTTRADAGSGDGFIRVDFDYPNCFTEAVLYFSGAAGCVFSTEPPHASILRRSSSSKAGKQPQPQQTSLGPPTNRVFLLDTGCKAKPFQPAVAHTLRSCLPDLNFIADNSESSGTLRRFCQVSAMNASRGSMVLYCAVKAASDDAAAERVLLHNELVLSAKKLAILARRKEAETGGEATTAATRNSADAKKGKKDDDDSDDYDDGGYVPAAAHGAGSPFCTVPTGVVDAALLVHGGGSGNGKDSSSSACNKSGHSGTNNKDDTNSDAAENGDDAVEEGKDRNEESVRSSKGKRQKKTPKGHGKKQTPLIEYSVVMPGALERYEKTRTKEKILKWFVTAIGVEACGQCVVADVCLDGRRVSNKSDDEDRFVTGPAGAAVNTNAFAFTDYHKLAARRHQEKGAANSLLYYWQGNAEIKRQAERVIAAEKGEPDAAAEQQRQQPGDE